MNRFHLAARAGVLLLVLSSGSWSMRARQVSDSSPASTDSKIVEEKTTVETRRVYETKTVRAKDPAPRKTAILVENHAGRPLSAKVAAFEDQLASRASGKDFSIISSQDVLGAIRAEPGTPGAKLDQSLSESSSALRLAQNLNAEFLLLATLGSFTTET